MTARVKLGGRAQPGAAEQPCGPVDVPRRAGLAGGAALATENSRGRLGPTGVDLDLQVANRHYVEDDHAFNGYNYVARSEVTWNPFRLGERRSHTARPVLLW